MKLFGAPYDYGVLVEASHTHLIFLNSQLSGRDWLAGDGITIADLAVFPFVMLTKDTTISLSKYLKVESWVKRIEAQDWYAPMPG